MEELVLFGFTFLFCFIGRLTLYLISKMPKKKKKAKKDGTVIPRNGISMEMRYLSLKFKISLKRIDKKSFACLISMLDALIISSTISIVVLATDNIILEMILGLILVFLFIYLIYGILGKILVWKGYDKDEL